MTLLHTMGLAGSIAVILYMLTYAFTKRHMPIVWHKIYLTITIFLYLIPFQYFITDYTVWTKKTLGLENLHQAEGGLENVSHFLIYIYNDSIYAHNIWLYILTAVCILSSACVFLYTMIKNRRLQRGIEECVSPNEDASAVLEQINSRTKVKVYQCRGIETPLAAGILRGRILLPDTELTQDRLQAALRHELVHIKAKDNFIKILLFIAVVLNFYNPLVYYLLVRWNTTAELYCDDRALAGKNEQEINDYAHMIIDFSEGKYGRSSPFMGLAKNVSEKQLKERILYMKRKKRNYGTISKVLGTLLIITAVFSASLTTAAYQPRHVDIRLDENYVGDEIETFFLADDCIYIPEDMWIWECAEYFSADCNIVFMAEDGSIYCHNDSEGNYESYAVCSHEYVMGKFVKHVKKSDGGCTLRCYSGKKCSKCGNIVYEQLLSTHSYEICIH